MDDVRVRTGLTSGDYIFGYSPLLSLCLILGIMDGAAFYSAAHGAPGRGIGDDGQGEEELESISNLLHCTTSTCESQHT